MVEPTARIRDGDGRQCPCNGVIEGGSGPRVSVPPVRFELRPAALNRRHIRRVGWQIQHLSAPTWSIASRMPAALWACRLSIITMSTGRSMGGAPAPHRCGRSRHRWRRQSSSRPRRLSSPAPPPWSRSPVVLRKVAGQHTELPHQTGGRVPRYQGEVSRSAKPCLRDRIQVAPFVLKSPVYFPWRTGPVVPLPVTGSILLALPICPDSGPTRRTQGAWSAGPAGAVTGLIAAWLR